MGFHIFFFSQIKSVFFFQIVINSFFSLNSTLALILVKSRFVRIAFLFVSGWFAVKNGRYIFLFVCTARCRVLAGCMSTFTSGVAGDLASFQS